MACPPVTIQIAFVHNMLSGVLAKKYDVRPFLLEAGIAPELLQEASARVTAEQYIALFRTLTDRLEDEGMALFSRPLRPGSFALLVRSAASANSLGASIRRAIRTFVILQDDIVPELLREGKQAGFSLRFTSPVKERQVFLHELMLRLFWRLLAWLAGGHLAATRFDFAFECPPYAGWYGKAYTAPLSFGCGRSAFWFDAELLNDPVHRTEAAVRGYLADGQGNIILPKQGDDLVSQRVRRQLQQAHTTWPDLVAMAKLLHMSTSTLQRRLATEGTSFQALKDELRRDVAIVRLNTSNASLAELASELGFADSAAFQRAFKGWTGSAPGVYRRGA